MCVYIILPWPFSRQYDATDRSSFYDVVHWLDETACHSDAAIRILVGNKADRNSTQIQVSVEEGAALAAKHGIAFFSASARDDVNVTEVKTQARARIVLFAYCI